MEELCKEYRKVAVPELTQNSYTYDEFAGWMDAQTDLCVADVSKERNIYKINDTIAEIAEAKFNGKPVCTICVEHADLKNAMKTVRELGLAGFENINDLKAVKASVGV